MAHDIKLGLVADKIPFQVEETIPGLPMEMPANPRFNLMYHVWPVKGNDRWKWNCDQIMSRIGIFNGYRICGIATDEKTVSPDEVAEFVGADTFDNFYLTQNNPKLGEMMTFLPMASKLPNTADDFTFYAHTKSTRHDVKAGMAPLVWTDCLYRLLLDDMPRVLDVMKNHPVCCAFRNTGQFHCNRHSVVSPDGNFWWVRNQHWFNRKGWMDLPLLWVGVEMAMSRVFSADEVGFTLAEFCERGDYMYKKEAWERFAPLLAERGIIIDF